MKVIGYIRVSTEEQAQHGVSLAAQEAKIRQYADLYGHDLVHIVVDAGASAKTLARPGLARVLTALKGGHVEGVVILKLDRLTRSVRDLGHLLETYFQKHALLSVMEQTDTSTAGGRLVLNLLISVSQWEREVIAERTSAALQHKKAQGMKLGAPALTDSATLARVCELRAAGLAMATIAQQLTAEGYQTQRGGGWHASTVHKILRRVPA
ncbi:MAG: recombinase family protein [Vulcanimicrobiota bacterium]